MFIHLNFEHLNFYFEFRYSCFELLKAFYALRVTASGHRLRLGLHRSLICFATLAFVPQRQEDPRCLPSPLVFQLISTHFTATLTVPASLTILNPDSIVPDSKVKP